MMDTGEKAIGKSAAQMCACHKHKHAVPLTHPQASYIVQDFASTDMHIAPSIYLFVDKIDLH